VGAPIQRYPQCNSAQCNTALDDLRHDEAEATQGLSRDHGGLGLDGGAGEVCAKLTDAAEPTRPVKRKATSNILAIDMLAYSPQFKRRPYNSPARYFQC